MSRKAARSIVVSFVFAAAAVLLNSFPARADEAKKEFAGYTKYVWYHAHYDINPDGTHVETQAWALKVLTDQGVSDANSASVSFSDRLQTVSFIYAYTLKKDGRKINVPAGNFQDETNTGKGNAAPMFSDIRTKTVAFPDVAVGDTVVLSYKLTQKEATFPGNYSLLQSFSKFEVYDEVKISLSAPRSLELRVYSRGVEGGETPSSDGRRNWAWSYRNQQIAKPERGAVSPRDYGPLIVATTFKDYGALAAAYNARAKRKSAPTSGISKLASDLTQDAHTPRDQARALYDWVSHNIKFAGNCVGVGAMVPHDADAVLANRMGDCKDHTALLQALLAAKGVASTPVLISSGSAYTLPEAPCIEAFNHVISYIPSLDLYADSTSEYTPFGSLPMSDAGKPVIHTANFTGIRHTPTANWKDNGWHSSTVINIHPDGSAEGETEVDARGRYAESIRYAMTYLQPNTEDSVVRRGLAVNGFTGTGILIKGDLKKVSDTYRYASKYKISDAMNLPGPGAMYIRSPLERAGSIAGVGTDEPDRTVDFSCGGDYSKQEFTIHLPKDVKVHAIPRNIEINGKYQSYKAIYQLKGNTIMAEREVEDRTPGPVCAPAVAVEYRRFAIGVRKDLRAQVLYE